MTSKTLHILMALTDGPLHGYGIKASVEERSGGSVTLGSGTLYEAIHRLQKAKWIEEVERREDSPSSGGPPRRFYALTTEGREAARQELKRLAELLRHGEERGLLEEPGGP